MTTLTWLLTALSLVGVVLNIKHHRSCFYIWAVTNACWAGVDWYKGVYAQATLFAVYFVLALYGMWEWRHHPTRR